MKKPLSSLVLAICLGAAACRSTETDTIELECICGQPAAVIEDCPHPLCLAGERNPENPDCVCGGLTIEG